MIDLTFGGIIPEYTLFLVGIIVLSIFSAYVITARWMVRVVIGSYVALVLVLVMPEKMLFTDYAALGLFAFLTILFAVVLGDRLINSSISWSQGHFPWLSMIFAFLMIMFLLAITLLFMPGSEVPEIISGDTQKFLTKEYWFFLWSAAPITFLLIFAPRY